MSGKIPTKSYADTRHENSYSEKVQGATKLSNVKKRSGLRTVLIKQNAEHKTGRTSLRYSLKSGWLIPIQRQ